MPKPKGPVMPPKPDEKLEKLFDLAPSKVSRNPSKVRKLPSLCN